MTQHDVEFAEARVADALAALKQVEGFLADMEFFFFVEHPRVGSKRQRDRFNHEIHAIRDDIKRVRGPLIMLAEK